ncbi:MAG: PQQ-binding-like beta-propeller repeat protein [Kiritimatiellaeota bacterium]|nr:PQQ-binding-like beta-propeller repeat protein [Kiritimatiellota bacterium]
MKTQSILFLAVLLGVATARAENWAQWRGPNFNGSTVATSLPTTWSKTENVTWVTPLPGQSGATPAVWGDSIFVSSPDAENNLLLLCLDRATGKVRWQKQLGTGNFTKGNNNLSTPSPATDGKLVIAMFGTGDLAALDFSGKVLWARQLEKEYGKLAINWLYGASPLLYNGRLYVQLLQRSPPTYKHALDDRPTRDSFLLCLDPQTGKYLWKQPRTTEAPAECMESYATPIPFLGKNGDEILQVGGDYVTAHNAETGAELWRCGGLNPTHQDWGRIVPSAVTCGDLVYASGPKSKMFLAIRDGGHGTVSDSHVAWRSTENAPDVCTPLVYDGRMFVLDGDKKVLYRCDPKTGGKLWSGAWPVDSVTRTSLTGADGKLYGISESGKCVVCAAGDEYQVLAENLLGEAPCRSSIAVSDGQLFIRTAKNLYCIGKQK